MAPFRYFSNSNRHYQHHAASTRKTSSNNPIDDNPLCVFCGRHPISARCKRYKTLEDRLLRLNKLRKCKCLRDRHDHLTGPDYCPFIPPCTDCKKSKNEIRQNESVDHPRCLCPYKVGKRPAPRSANELHCPPESNPATKPTSSFCSSSATRPPPNPLSHSVQPEPQLATYGIQNEKKTTTTATQTATCGIQNEKKTTTTATQTEIRYTLPDTDLARVFTVFSQSCTSEDLDWTEAALNHLSIDLRTDNPTVRLIRMFHEVAVSYHDEQAAEAASSNGEELNEEIDELNLDESEYEDPDVVMEYEHLLD